MTDKTLQRPLSQTLEHYTLNSAHSLKQPFTRLQPGAKKLLVPFVKKAFEQGCIEDSVPGFSDYSFKLTVDSQTPGAFFDIKLSEQILATNAVAWTEDGAFFVWKLISDLYRKTLGSLSSIKIQQPLEVPWLATIVFPYPVISDCTWLADFECCLAQTICLELP